MREGSRDGSKRTPPLPAGKVERPQAVRVSRLCPKSWEAIQNLPKPTGCVILARLQLFDKKKDSRLLLEGNGLRRWWGNPWGFESPLRHHANYKRDFGFPPKPLFS